MDDDKTRLSEELLDLADIVGDHPEPSEDFQIIKGAPKTKVVKNSSKGVRTK